nr:MAG TPA: tail protein [Caudoviricetes sp.]
MQSKEQMLQSIHKIYRQDPWIQALFQAAGLPLDDVEAQLQSLYDQYFFDTATWGLKIYEKEMAIKSSLESTYDERRAVLEARWKSSGKVDIYLLQAVANSWRNEGITVDFIDGKISVTFTGERGFFDDWSALEEALDNVKPAHLALLFTVIILLRPTTIRFGAALQTGTEMSIYPIFSDDLSSTYTLPIVAYTKQGTYLSVYPLNQEVK